jgi:hypothetical protein
VDRNWELGKWKGTVVFTWLIDRARRMYESPLWSSWGVYVSVICLSWDVYVLNFWLSPDERSVGCWFSATFLTLPTRSSNRSSNAECSGSSDGREKSSPSEGFSMVVVDDENFLDNVQRLSKVWCSEVVNGLMMPEVEICGSQ